MLRILRHDSFFHHLPLYELMFGHIAESIVSLFMLFLSLRPIPWMATILFDVASSLQDLQQITYIY